MKLMQFSKFFLPAGMAFALHAADVRVLEEIVAKVNGDIVTRTELDKSRSGMLQDLQQRGAKAEQLDQLIKEREKDILRDRIDQLLLLFQSRTKLTWHGLRSPGVRQLLK